MKKLVLFAMVLAMTLPGCSLLRAAAPALPAIAAVISDAATTLEYIDAGVREWQEMTNPPQDQIVRYERLRRAAFKALSGATRAIRGTQDLDQEQYNSAFYEFKRAYSDLQQFLEATGAMSGGRFASGGEMDTVPVPLAITHKVEDG